VLLKCTLDTINVEVSGMTMNVHLYLGLTCKMYLVKVDLQ
jgi:hypothetical protein